MPESEPKPKLIELVAPGAGQGWKAVLRSGKAVVIHEISAPAPEAAAALPRVQRLAENRHPALSPVLAWGTDPNGIWVAVEPNEGTPLGTILSRGPLTSPAAAALGAALLSGVSALHESGIAMGGFNAAAVRVTGNGEVRLSGHPAAAVRGAPSQSDLRADVRSCGMAICAAFGVDPAGAPAPPNIPPGLVVTMRSMASGAMGPAADRAQGALREMASALLAPDRATAAAAELATRAGGREMPSITPFLPKEEQVQAPAPTQAPAPQPQQWGQPRQETPPPAPASYEPPARARETYDQIPTPYQPPAPAAPKPPTPAVPSAAPIPTWDEPVPTPPAAQESPPAPAPYEPPAAAAPSPAETGEALPWEVPASLAPPPTPAPYEPPAPKPAQYEPPPAPKTEAPAPAPAADKPTWTAIPTPSWTPSQQIEEEQKPAPLETVAAAAPAAAAASSTQAPIRTPATTPIPEPERKPPAPRRPVRDEPSGRPPWLIPAIAAIAILLLLGGGTGIFLASRGGNPGGTPTASPSSKPSAKTSPSPSQTGGPRAVPTYAPATAPPITGVAFCTKGKCADPSADTNCRLGSSCRVTVEIKFSAVQRSDVAYVLKFFDRCTGTTTDLPGNHFTPPGFTTVDITTANVALPSGAKSAALVAVTTSPTSAASAPLMLGADTC